MKDWGTTDGQPGFTEEGEVVASTPNFDIGTGKVRYLKF